MQKNILYGVCGLIIGLLVGFFFANSVNKSATAQIDSSPNSPNVPSALQQIPNITVKEQPVQPKGGMLPQIAETLELAEKEPNNFEVQNKAGDMYAKIERFDKALEYWEKANKINADDYQIIVKIGNTYFDIKEFEKAEKWYLQALEKKSDDVNVRTDLGITFVERANPDLDRAIKEFQNSLKSDPKHEPTLYNLAVAFYKKNNTEEVQKILTQIESINPQSTLAARLREVIMR
ncbi:MAG: tetratricopeptide repeat protein [Pyrinomonadaceae bacterium]|nr:tetratricopeptide repeat protein [Acidobacteriota bacterium]